MLIYFMICRQWAVVITLIVYQAIKTIAVWDLKKIKDAHKISKSGDQVVAKIDGKILKCEDNAS